MPTQTSEAIHRRRAVTAGEDNASGSPADRAEPSADSATAASATGGACLHQRVAQHARRGGSENDRQKGRHQDHPVGPRQIASAEHLRHDPVLARTKKRALRPHQEQHQQETGESGPAEQQERRHAQPHHRNLGHLREHDDATLAEPIGQVSRIPGKQDERKRKHEHRDRLPIHRGNRQGQQEHELLEQIVVERAQKLGHGHAPKGPVVIQSGERFPIDSIRFRAAWRPCDRIDRLLPVPCWWPAWPEFLAGNRRCPRIK
jgi:hypothetical protein